MITTSSRSEKAAKQEESPLPGGGSSRQWSSAGFRNPRIVRVSRTFGGKDRHSKVCTVRGLRDRRIRLSVPTAVQLYELQDRLGLSQPSKVIDWLIDNTKLDIDKLPPLQFPPPGQLLAQFHHHDLMSSQDHQFSHKLFGLSPYNSHNHNNNNSSTDHPLSQIGLGQFSLPPQIDASSSSSLFNSHLFLSYGQPSSSAASLFAPMYQLTGATDHPAVTIMNNNNNHDARSSSSASRMIINHNHQIQLLTGGATTTTSSTSPNTTSSLIVPNYSLMSSSSLHNSTSNNANEVVPQNLFKSFPSIFNPRFLSQSSFGNRQEKDHS